jgi:hypothetical protein
MKELIPARNGYNSEASCLQSMPQGLALFEAGLGLQIATNIKQISEKLSAHFTVAV